MRTGHFWPRNGRREGRAIRRRLHAASSRGARAGLPVGSSQKEFRAKLEELVDRTAASASRGTAKKSTATPLTAADGDLALAPPKPSLGETEYRLNWLPLGGYVKMLGQTTSKPNSKPTIPAPTTASRLAANDHACRPGHHERDPGAVGS